METDFAFIEAEKSDVVAWVMAVPDPRRFGVAELGADGWVKRFIEKPTSMENNLAVIGCYYFKDGQALLAAVNEQMEKGRMFKNEYFLTDAITIMIERGAKVRTHEINTWLDTGTIDATLETNRRLLDKTNPTWLASPGATIRPPVFIHPSAVIENSQIGPYASISAHCRISNCQVSDSILEEHCEISDAIIFRSLIGRQVKIQGLGDGQVLTLNLGDHSSVMVTKPS
jgi:glucose-1-phosphate thymidylyltransferase